MLKPLSVTTESVKPKTPANTVLAQRVFRAMHGYYGSQFLAKFANGVVVDGEDKGVADALKVWAYELRHFSEAVVLDAIARCKAQHAEWPPTLPQFVALCEAAKPREAVRFALPMSPELVKQRNAPHVEKLRELRERIAGPKEAAPATGLQLLFAAIGDAIDCAGGDGAAAMVKLEREICA